jgi:hypothetical protein
VGESCDKRIAWDTLQVTDSNIKDVEINENEKEESECMNACSNKGLCINAICYCEEGSFGYDCSFSENLRRA